MFKLTKTEKKVLELASRSHRGEVSTVQEKGVISRDLAAIRKLRVKGMVVFQGDGHLEEFSFRTGRDTVYYHTTDRITDQGREFLGTLS